MGDRETSYTYIRLVKMMFRLRMSRLDVTNFGDFIEVVGYERKWGKKCGVKNRSAHVIVCGE